MLRSILFLIGIFFSTISIAQEDIIEPILPYPEFSFNNAFEEQKITNPRFLNGKVKKVKRVFTQYESAETKKYQEHYVYELDKNNEVTFYISDLEEDGMYEEAFSMLDNSHIKNDTIINEDIIDYTFKKGRLVLKTDNQFNSGFLDSTLYIYKKDKLTEIKGYRSLGAEEVQDDGTIDESYMLFSEFELLNYDKATYNKKGVLLSKKGYYNFYETVDIYETTYQYKNKKLESYKTVKKSYNAYNIDFSTLSEEWNFNEADLVADSHEVISGIYQYDTKGRITLYQSERIGFHQDSNQELEEKEKFSYVYNDDNTKMEVFVIRDYKNYISKEKLAHQEVVYEYKYDAKHNPIEINSYILKDGKKHLDKSTILTITYF